MASSRGSIRNLSYFTTHLLGCFNSKPAQPPTQLFDRKVRALRESIREHALSSRAIRVVQSLVVLAVVHGFLLMGAVHIRKHSWNRPG